MVLLESEQFLTELTRLFQKCRLSGSVFITLKKCKQLSTRQGQKEAGKPSDAPAGVPGVPSFRSRGRNPSAAHPLRSLPSFSCNDGRTKPIPRKGSVEGFEPSDNKCLLRATDGKKKISTVVSSKEVNKFQMAYSNLLRANMDGLKKRDKKSKSKKSKAAQ
ncbi:signal recognition particle 14 kDa protein [Prionailurus iriomotensis]